MKLNEALLVAALTVLHNVEAINWTLFDRTVTQDDGTGLYRITDGDVEWLHGRLERHIRSAEMLPARYQFVYSAFESDEIAAETNAQITDNEGVYGHHNVQMVQEVFTETDWAYLCPYAPTGYTWELFLQVVARFPAFCGKFKPMRPNLQCI